MVSFCDSPSRSPPPTPMALILIRVVGYSEYVLGQ